MKRIIWLLCLLPLFLRADAESEGEDLGLYHHVNVVTGDLNLMCQDAFVRGAKPLFLTRTYTSTGALERKRGQSSFDLETMRGLPVMQGGWGWFSHVNMYVEPTENDKNRVIYIPEKSGGFTCYTYQGKEQELAVYKPERKGGRCTGTISARNNPQHNILRFCPINNRGVLYLPDGGVRIYQELRQERKYPSDPSTESYYLGLIQEVLPSGHLVRYTYNRRDELRHVEVCNPTGTKVLAAAHVKCIPPEKKREDTFHYQVTTSDGGVFDYRSINYKYRNYLSSVQSNCRPEEGINYQPGRKGIGARLHTFSLGGNLQFSARYFGPDDKKEAKRWKRGKKEPRFETDRVASLHAPLGPNDEVQPFAHFFYQMHHTDARDIDYILTRYHHDGEHLHHIEYFDEKDQVQSQLQLMWDGSLLKAKVLLDRHGRALFSRTFSYDDAGDILEETFWGNLTGAVSGPFEIDQEGRLAGAETYSRRYQYRQENHVPLVEEEDGGLTYRYAYLSGTDLVTAKLICDRNAIWVRQFYFYDADHLLVAEIADDGTDEDPASLNNVTERRIKRYELHPQNGLVIAANEFYWDRQTGQEILIKRSEYAYSPQNQIIEEAVYDANRTYRYTLYTAYDRYGHIIRKTMPLGQENTYRYNNNGHLLESKEVGSNRKIYTVDLAGRPKACQEIDEEGNCRTTYSHYDAKGRLLSQTDSRGNRTDQTYDAFGRCLTTTFPAVETEDGEPIFPQVSYTYDDLGNVASMTTPQGHVVKTTYNSFRKPIHVIEADGAETFHTYTKQGMLAQTVHPDQTQETLTYDLFQRMTSKTVSSSDGTVLSQEKWEYNAFHLLAYTNERGLTTRYTYDGAGRKTGEIAEDRTKTWTYDPLGFQETETAEGITHVQLRDVQGRVVEEWTEDEKGTCENRMQFFYDENNKKQKALRTTSQGESVDLFVHDGEGRLVKHVDPYGAVSEWQYTEVENHIGQRVQQKISIDPLGNRVIETYDALGHLASIEKTDPEGRTVAKDRSFYDPSGNQIKRISSIYQGHALIKTVTAAWEYDPMGRVVKEVEADQKTTIFRYDSRGRVSEKTLPSGTLLSYVYDGLGRQIELFSSDGTVHYHSMYRCGPDPTIIVDHIHHFRIQREYNAFGQLVHEIGPQGFEYTWNYDRHGRCTDFTLPTRASVAYTYSGAHLNSVAKYSPGGSLQYTHHYTQFDPNGHVQKEILVNQRCSLATERDLLERPIAQTSPHLRLARAYGPSGLVTQTDNSLFGPKDYAYDPLNQLVKEAENTYSFDSFGNPSDCEVNDCNQVLSSQEATFQYDADGNLTKRSTPEGETQYRYDALGRLTELITPSKTVRFGYDPFSRLLFKKTEYPWWGDEKVFYLYDQEVEIGTATEQAEILQLKVLGLGICGDIGAAVAIELGPDVYIPLHDFSGNIIALVSMQNKLVESYDIDAFGKEKPSSSLNPWHFCSKRTEEGLIFFGVRFYDPSLGRWITPDPAGSLDSPNLYLYVRNSPLNRLDLFGLLSKADSPLYPPDVEKNITIEIGIPEIQSLVKGGLADCVARIDGVTVDLVVACGHVHLLEFTPEETNRGKINILDHFAELVPKEGAIIGIGILQNGINVKRGEFREMNTSFVEQIKEGTLTFGIYNPSQGLLLDLFRVLKEFLGFETPIVDRTRQLMNAFNSALSKMESEALIGYCCHSEAGLIVRNSIEGMTDAQRRGMRNRLVTRALGPASPLSKEHALDAVNYYSEKDRVTKRFGMRYLDNPSYDIRIVECLTLPEDREFIAGDHGFMKETYQDVLYNSLQELRSKYGFYEAR